MQAPHFPIILFLQGVVTYSSTYVLVALTIDRYDAIRHPMSFSRGHRKARYLIICAWALSCAFSAPLLVLFEEKMIQGTFKRVDSPPATFGFENTTANSDRSIRI